VPPVHKVSHEKEELLLGLCLRLARANYRTGAVPPRRRQRQRRIGKHAASSADEPPGVAGIPFGEWPNPLAQSWLGPPCARWADLDRLEGRVERSRRVGLLPPRTSPVIQSFRAGPKRTAGPK
jgi:hypothetical protein